MDRRGLITEANRKWWTLGAMCLSMFMIMLDSRVVNVALSSIQRDLDKAVDSSVTHVTQAFTCEMVAVM